jgi:hypothetical protein
VVRWFDKVENLMLKQPVLFGDDLKCQTKPESANLMALVRQAVAIIESGRVCEAVALMRDAVACPPPAFVHPNAEAWPPSRPQPPGLTMPIPLRQAA